MRGDQNEQNTQAERTGAGSSAVREKDIPTMCMDDLWTGVELLREVNRVHHGPPEVMAKCAAYLATVKEELQWGKGYAKLTQDVEYFYGAACKTPKRN